MNTPETPKKIRVHRNGADLKPASQDGWFVLTSPYSAPLVDGLKQRIPSAGRAYQPADKTWQISEAYRPMVLTLLAEVQIPVNEVSADASNQITIPISDENAELLTTDLPGLAVEEAPKEPVIPEDGIAAWVYAFEALSVPERMRAYQGLSKSLEGQEGWNTVQAAWKRLVG
jgi:hypothetical protein